MDRLENCSKVLWNSACLLHFWTLSIMITNTDEFSDLRIDGKRLWDSLMQLARIGATEKGGVCRLALTELDGQGRDLGCEWARALACSVRVHALGNICNIGKATGEKQIG